jgi:MFS superfamily sulfate permease-like transporter
VHENRGAALAVAFVIVAFFAVLGALVVVLGWTGFSIYALVKWIGSAPDEANPVAVILLFVGVVTLLTTGLLAGLALVGRSMTPRKRRRDREWSDDAEIPGL